MSYYLAFALAGVSLFFSSCGSSGRVSENHKNRGLNPGVGPFDSRGNYVESWADDKSKGVAWRAPIVINEDASVNEDILVKKKKRRRVRKRHRVETLSNASPYPGFSHYPQVTRQTYNTPPSPPVVGVRTPPSRPYETRALKARSSHRKRATVNHSSRKRGEMKRRIASARKEKLHKTSRPLAVKVKPKHKPPIRYTIKKGDTLYGLSRKFKVSVSLIQGANGLKGSNLRVGQKLLIPRR